MASNGVRLGYGSVIRIGRGSGPTWTTLTGCEDFSTPDDTVADEEVTSHDSPNRTEEFIPGFRTAADWSVTKHFVAEDAEDILLSALKASGENVLLEIRPAGAAVPLVWTGYVKKWMASLPVKGAMKAELTMKIMAQVVA